MLDGEDRARSPFRPDSLFLLSLQFLNIFLLCAGPRLVTEPTLFPILSFICLRFPGAKKIPIGKKICSWNLAGCHGVKEKSEAKVAP